MSSLRWFFSLHAAFIKDHTLNRCSTNSHVTTPAKAPRALTMEHKRDEKRKKKKKKKERVAGPFSRCYKINAISRVFMNRARCQIHNFKQIDFQLLVRRTTSRCATDGARATKGVSTLALCYSAVKKKKKTAVQSVVCVLNHRGSVGWRWREGQEGDSRGEMKAHH